MVEEELGGRRGRILQRSKVRKDGWTKARRTAFLKELARTCNVSMAATASGLNTSSAYLLRRRDPVFAALWEQALALGYDRLETALLHHALTELNAIGIGGEVSGDGDGDGAGGGTAAVGFSATGVRLALSLLNRHRASVEGRRPVGRQRRKTEAEIDATLRRQLDTLSQRLNEEPAHGDAAAGDA